VGDAKDNTNIYPQQTSNFTQRNCKHKMAPLITMQKSPERAFALQKYLILHSQHDALQKHINQVTASIPDSPTGYTDRHRNFSISSDSSTGSDASISPLNPPIPNINSRRGSLPTSFGHMQHSHREEPIHYQRLRMNRSLK
jgi:hypothetical protein